MPHLLKEYAKNLGVKMSKPVFKEHFFPLEFNKYIVVHNDDGSPSRNYKYYNIVLHILEPFLKKHDIKIVQLGSSPIQGANKILNLPIKQKSYLISKSLLYFGCDGILSQIANLKKIPSVNIYGNVFANISKPLLGDSSKVINIEPKWDKNPCFNSEDPQNQINSIKPEVIAQAILNLLKIEKLKVNFKTLQAGFQFGVPVVEIVPTTFQNIQVDNNQDIFIRADYGLDKEALKKYCANHKVSIFFNYAVDIKEFLPFKSNIKQVFFLLDETSEKISEEYFDNLNSFNIKYQLLTKNLDVLPKIQNDYFENIIQTYNIDSKKDCTVSAKSKFITRKKILKDGKIYTSLAHLKKNLDNNDIVIDSDDFWREAQQFFIYEQG